MKPIKLLSSRTVETLQDGVENFINLRYFTATLKTYINLALEFDHFCMYVGQCLTSPAK